MKVVSEPEKQALEQLQHYPRSHLVQAIKFSQNPRSVLPPRSSRIGQWYAFLSYAGKTLVKLPQQQRSSSAATFWTESKRARFRKQMLTALQTPANVGYGHLDLYARNIAWNGHSFTLLDMGKLRKRPPQQINVNHSLNILVNHMNM